MDWVGPIRLLIDLGSWLKRKKLKVFPIELKCFMTPDHIQLMGQFKVLNQNPKPIILAGIKLQVKLGRIKYVPLKIEDHRLYDRIPDNRGPTHELNLPYPISPSDSDPRGLTFLAYVQRTWPPPIKVRIKLVDDNHRQVGYLKCSFTPLSRQAEGGEIP